MSIKNTGTRDRAAAKERAGGESASAAGYAVFPGISVVYHDPPARNGTPEEQSAAGDVLGIFHCREGHTQCRIENELCRISPGDLLIVRPGRSFPPPDFPPQHCRGIAVRIDTAETPDCLSRFLPGVAVSPKAIKEKFCGKKGYHLARSAPPIEQIFSALYAVPDEIRQSYAKIKILELLLLLSTYPAGDESPNGRPASPLRTDLAKAVAGYLAENMKERITLERTAERFHVSATTIKTAFRSAFGVSFYAYIKARKMQSAADMLACTCKTVSDIAAEHGYDNPSKFATAFRAVKGISPTEYRLQSAKRHG